ncbi:MAG: tetratricopeptide repeat protein [Melioribacteraceae bacterium]|nr:tetratricopeptide repeat protein [Melioribacteraceae bacterium]
MAKKKQIKANKTESQKNSSAIFLLLVTGIAAYFYFTFKSDRMQDDAFIFFRYAENFINGHGLVFNIGEYVEGYTGFLWLINLIFLARIGFDLISVSSIFGIAYGFGVVAVSVFLTNELRNNTNVKNDSNSKWYSRFASIDLYPALLLVFNSAVHYWAGSGMETMMFSYLLIQGIYFYIKYDLNKIIKKRAHIFLMLAALTRPEGILVYTVVFFHKWISFYTNNEKDLNVSKQSFLQKENLIALGIFVLPNLLLVIFRLIYYGYPLPNTFYAKSGTSIEYFSAGFQYFVEFTSSNLLFGIMLIVPLLLLRKNNNRKKFGLLYSIVIIYTLYIMFIGGDVLPIFRFFIPVLPLIFILFIISISTVKDILRSKLSEEYKSILNFGMFIIVAAVGAYNYLSIYRTVDEKSNLEKNLIDKMIISGEWFKDLNDESNKTVSIAATTIGALSYYSGDARIIDMLGLTDEEIAHNPKPIKEISETATGWKEKNYNVEYVLDQKPDFFYFSTGLKPSALAERALFSSKEFLRGYYPYIIKPMENLNYQFTIYKRKPEAVFASDTMDIPPNPNFKIEFVNLYNTVLNRLSRGENLSELVPVCEELIRISPFYFADAYRVLGEIYARIGDDQKALENFNKAIRIDRFSTISYGNLLGRAIMQRDIENVKYYTRLLARINPDILEIYQVDKLFRPSGEEQN